MKVNNFVTVDNKAHFSEYNPLHDMFWYCIKNLEDGELYSFPIPRTDVGRGTLHHEEKSVTLMRWIRKAIIENTFKKEECVI